LALEIIAEILRSLSVFFREYLRTILRLETFKLENKIDERNISVVKSNTLKSSV